MKKLQNKSLIRAERTLIIACHKDYPGMVGEWKDNVFLIESSGNAIQRYDFRQREYLRHYIEEKGCRQILVVGHLHDNAILKICEDLSSRSPLSGITFNLKCFLGDHDKDAISREILSQMLIELNTIQQCELLLENEFIKECVGRDAVHVIGVVAGTADRKANLIFYDGISYNNLIRLN